MNTDSKAKQWKQKGERAAAVEDLDLPSGMTIRARRPGPLHFMERQRLPESLLASASGAKVSPADLSAADLREIAAFMRDVLIFCCIEPRVSLDPQGDDEIHPRDIPEEDYRFILNWAMRVPESRALETFHGQRQDVSPGADGKNVRAAAVVDGGDRGPGVIAGV